MVCGALRSPVQSSHVLFSSCLQGLSSTLVSSFIVGLLLKQCFQKKMHCLNVKRPFCVLTSFPFFSRLSSWVQQKLLSIGSTGCLHSLSMQSKTQSLENGSISNVPLLTMTNWDWEEGRTKSKTGDETFWTFWNIFEGNWWMPVD